MNEQIERIMFELWARPDSMQARLHPDTGEYMDHGMRSAWSGWKAAKESMSVLPRKETA